MPAAYIQNTAEFDALLSTEPLLIVGFTATWCEPCKLVAPLIDRLADEYGDRVKILKLDFDLNKEVVKRYGVRSIPVVMFFVKGALTVSLLGVKEYEQYCVVLEQYLA